MKKIVFIILIVLNFFKVYAQNTADHEYIIQINGYIGLGKEDCGDSHGLQSIKLFFESGPPVYVFGSALPKQHSSQVFFSSPYTFKGDNKVTHIEFFSHERYNDFFGCADKKDDIQKIAIPDVTTCFFKKYLPVEIFPTHVNSRNIGQAYLNIAPKPKILFSDTSANITSPYTTCKTDEVGIESPAGFVLPNTIYTWEFFDLLNIDTQTHPDFLPYVEAVIRTKNEYNNCRIRESDPDQCTFQFNRWEAAVEAKRNYSGPRTIQVAVPKWKVIPSKTGQSSIKLKLSDLYADTVDQNKAINKNILVRINPGCANVYLSNISNQLTIVYLPDLPKITSIAKKDPTCYGSNDGGFTITFDRQLATNETIDLALRLDNNVIDNNEGIRRGNMTGRQYVWRSVGLKQGNYTVVTTGGSINGSEVAHCDTGTNPIFKLIAPSPIEFSAITVKNQTCFGVNDGEIKIAITSGGTGIYQYSLNNGVWVEFDYPSVVVTGLASIIHGVQVRKNVSGGNVCLAPTSATVPISAAIEITHQLGIITHPGYPTASDGEIAISSISGGTPLANNAYAYQLRDVDSNIIASSGELSAGGDVITGLRQGNYRITYTDDTDGNGCSKGINELIVIKDPDPITFTTTITRDCVNENNGEITLSISGGYPKSTNPKYIIKWYVDEVLDGFNSTITLDNAQPGKVYRVEVTDDRGGTASQNNIIIPSNIMLRDSDITSTHNMIYGDNIGTIRLNITSGTFPYEVNWDRVDGAPFSATGTTINNLYAGEYRVVINEIISNDATTTISECPIVRIITINEPDELLVTIQETIAIDCYGDLANLTAVPTGGSQNYSYRWFKNDVEISGQNTAVISDQQEGTYSVQIEDGYTDTSAVITLVEPSQVALQVSKSDVSCYGGNDGTIILNPQGGTPPYSFSIDNKVTYVLDSDLTNLTIEGVIAGSYQVWLRDANGCEIDTPEAVTLVQPTEIVITVTEIFDVTTLGGTNGSIAITIIGGTGAYDITWTKAGDPGFTSKDEDLSGLSFGMYTIAVRDDNNCVVESTFEVREPLPMVVKIDITNPILCNGDILGELTATVTGGYPIESTPSDFEYRWYIVDNGVDIPINIDMTLDRIIELPAGIYKVMTNDVMGANAETFIELSEPDDLVVTFISNTHVLCNGEATAEIDITVTGGPRDQVTGEYLPYIYNWSKEEDPAFQSNVEDPTDLTAGTYQIVVVDDNLCTISLSENVVITQPDAPLEISNVIPTHLTGFKAGNGSITLDVSGGVLPHRYRWSNLENTSYTSSSQDIYDLPIGVYQLIVIDRNGCTTSITQEITEPNQLIVEIQPLTAGQGIQCYGEETIEPLVTTTVGGIGAYTYQWYEQSDPSTILFTTPETQTTLLAGIYTVVVTDQNGNTDSNTYIVSQPDELSTTETVTNIQCAGDSNGAIDITVQGGVAPFTYAWSTGEITEDLTGVTAGNYRVIVKDANECTYTKTITIEQPPALFVDGEIIRINPSSSGARDGSITVTIAGGVLPYRYKWYDEAGNLQFEATNVLSNIGGEKYSLTVTDRNNCILEIPDVDLFEPPVLEVSISSVNVITCYGDTEGSISASAKGGRPFNATKQYNYQWYNAVANTPVGSDNFLLENIGAGTYTVLVTDASGTTATQTFVFEGPQQLGVILENDFVNCGDQNDWTITPDVIGGTAPFTFLWNTGATTTQLDALVAGVYSVVITDVRGCTTTNEITLVPPAPLTSTYTTTIATCYDGCDGNVFVKATGGVPPYTYEWSNNATTGNLTNVCAATYVVKITDAKGCQITEEILLNNPEEFIVDLGEDITLCKDQIALLDATSDRQQATYLWTSSTTGFTSTEAIVEVSLQDFYTVVVTDGIGCTTTDTIFVDRTSNLISAEFIASSQVFAGEEFVIVNISDPLPDDIVWTFPEGAEVKNEDNKYAELVFNTPGEYEIMVTAYRGLCSTTQTKKVLVVEKELGEETEEETSGIDAYIDYLVYPNPTTDRKFTIDISLPKAQPVNLKIFGMVNNNIVDSRKDQGKDTYQFKYSLSSLSSGIYFILLEIPSGSQVRKLIVE